MEKLQLFFETYVIHSREGRSSVADIDEGIGCSVDKYGELSWS